MKRSLLCGLIFLCCVALTGAVLAQSEPGGEPQSPSPTAPNPDAPAPSGVSGMVVTSNVSGTVVSSSGSSLVIKADSGARMMFQVDSSSSLPVGIAAGDRVSVDYDTMSVGTYHVSMVSSATMPPGSETSGRTEVSNTDPDALTNAEGSESLPQTASPLPLIALIGGLSLGAAAGLRLLSRVGA